MAKGQKFGTSRPNLIAFNRRHRASFRYEDRNFMWQTYVVDKLSLRATAQRANCSLRTIVRWLGYHEIKTRPVGVHEARRLFGPANPSWTGRTICPKCGNRKAHKSGLCRQCSAWMRATKGIADVMVIIRQWIADNWRPVIFERDRFTCQQCGDVTGGNLHAHHLIPLAVIVRQLQREWALDLTTAEARYAFTQRLIAHELIQSIANGLTLCAQCHLNHHLDKGFGPTGRPRATHV